MDLSAHHEYVENKLTSLKKYVHSLDAVTAWMMEMRARLNISRDMSQLERDEVIDSIMVIVLSQLILEFSFASILAELNFRSYISHRLNHSWASFNRIFLALQASVKDREMEIKDVLENYTNLEKECESAKQPISAELQVRSVIQS